MQNPPISSGGIDVVAPVRAEPRAWLANERTFLSWMNAASTLVVVSSGITAAADTPIIRLTGVMLAAPGVVFVANALMMYYLRRHQLDQRSVSSYAVRGGPLVLCLTASLAVFLNLILNLIRLAGGTKNDKFDFSTLTST